MALPLLDINLRSVLGFGFKELRSQPDRYLADIFGDAFIDQNAALLGQEYVKKIKTWLTETKIPIVFGFDLSAVEIPAITINLQSATPQQQFLGDRSLSAVGSLPSYQRVVLVPAFEPKLVSFSSDRSTAVITLPDSMSADQQALFLPGISILDANQKEFTLQTDPTTGNPLIAQIAGGTPVTNINASKLELVSQYSDAQYLRGGMYYQQTLRVDVHGRSDRNEGIWLYQIVMWMLLKYRPLLISAFGMDISTPSASDFVKVDAELPGNVWTRTISVSCNTLYTWEDSTQQDIVGLLLSIAYDRAQN